jgi:hypothetical protein
VHWDVEQADGVLREHLVCVAWDGHVLTLPPYATDPVPCRVPKVGLRHLTW